jgi:aromatic ring-opening dioxygenase catalytic subunit (LigB family)
MSAMPAAAPATQSSLVTLLSALVPVLSLLVALGTLVLTRANLQWQSRVAAREAWRREFREQVVALLSTYAVLREHARSHTTGDPEKEKRLAEINEELTPAITASGS